LNTETLAAYIRKEIPVTNFCDFTIIQLDDEKSIIEIPFTQNTKNHVGSMYFAALAMGADLAAGLFAMHYIDQSGQNIVLVFKDFQANFLRRAEKNAWFTCSDKDNVAALIEKAVSSGEREDLKVNVVAHANDDPNEVFMTGSLTLSVKRK